MKELLCYQRVILSTHHGGIQPEEHGALQYGQPNVMGDDDATRLPQRSLDCFLQHGRLRKTADQEEETHTADLRLCHQLLCEGR